MPRPLLLWLTSTLLVIGVLATFMIVQQKTRNQPFEALNGPPSMAPEAQIQRITSRLLLHKIEKLRTRAVYLQHREEGQALVDILRKTRSSHESKTAL